MTSFKSQEDRMREREYFHSLKVPPGMWKIIRVDGRSFSRLTKDMKHPFDLDFRDRMIYTAKTLVKDFDAVYAHTHSDEISILFRPDWELFSNEVEKLVSTSAAKATRAFNHDHKQHRLGEFDSRIWFSGKLEDVLDYFDWRQSDCYRNAVSSVIYWHLIQDLNYTSGGATRVLEGKNTDWKLRYLSERKIDFDSLPRWQKNGVAIYYESYTKSGTNKLTGESVLANRRKLKVNSILPVHISYGSMIWELATYGRANIEYKPSVIPRPEMLLDKYLMV
jgi:tRNA(His) guanylyltransferase